MVDGEGSWQWVTGEGFDYSHWCLDEPNGGTSENYAGVRGDGGYWDDLNESANASTGYVESGTNVQTWSANDGAAQRFMLRPAANPKAISAKVYDITPDGYKVQVELDAPRGIQFAEFPTWTTGKADDVWGRGVFEGNVVTYEVKASDHGNRHGLYWTRVYVSDNYGSRCWVDAEQNEVLVPEKVSSVGDKTHFLVPADMSWDDAEASMREVRRPYRLRRVLGHHHERGGAGDF